MQWFESDTLMFVSVVALAGWIIWLHFRRRQQAIELKRMQMHLSTNALQKFGAADEFVAFLQSKEGRSMLCDDQLPEKGRSRTSIRLVQIGSLMLFAGVGLYLSAYWYGEPPNADMAEVLSVFTFTGTTAISLGVGLFVAALVTSVWERWSGERNNKTT